jgi:hypothetical protein
MIFWITGAHSSKFGAPGGVTKVSAAAAGTKVGRVGWLVLRCGAALFLLSLSLETGRCAQNAGAPVASAELYRQLRSLGLDAAKTYRARDLAIDKEDIHISLDDGTIAFTAEVNGRVTGAFFAGEGEVLLVPPNQAERASLALFTGQAVLEEKFVTAYFRFSDNTFEELLPNLRPLPAIADSSSGGVPRTAAEFVERWDPVARSLSESDALRLLGAFTNGSGTSPEKVFRARLAGARLGTLDLILDTGLAEQISVAQAGFSQNGTRYYDILASFPMRSARRLDSEPGPVSSAVPSDPIKILRYAIRAHALPPHQLEAEARLDLSCRRPGQRTIFFELSRNLGLKSVKWNGKSVDFLQNEAILGSELARRGNDVVAVLLPRPLPCDQESRLEFSYSGDVMSEAGGGLMYVGARGTWYPNRGAAMANFDVEFRYPSSWTLLATGKRIQPGQERQAAGGEQVSRWVSERPMPLAGFNLGRYVSSEARAPHATVAVYAARAVENALLPPLSSEAAGPEAGRRPYSPLAVPPRPAPPSPAENMQVLAQRAASTIEFISQRIGAFPYSELALTEMPGPESQGWPGLVFLSSYAFLAPEKRVESGNETAEYLRILYGRLMPAHEIAHQWWGDGVVWATYRDEWLMESLANYCALLEIEKENPEDFQRVMEHYRQDLLRRNAHDVAYQAAGPVTLGRRLSSSKFPDGYDRVAYGRGTWLIHMLRCMFRDTAGAAKNSTRATPAAAADKIFFDVLRGLLEHHFAGTLSTQEFIAAFEQQLPEELRYEDKKSLQWFLEGWVNGAAIPKFEITQLRLTERNGKLAASGKLLQSQAPDRLATSVPLYALTGNGPPFFLRRIFADGPETSFKITAPAGTKKILVDSYGTVLRRP